MSDRSTIEWTDATWNPVTGCTQVGPGCDHCYAMAFAERFRGVAEHPYEQGFDLKLWPERLGLPLTWRRDVSRKCFSCCSSGSAYSLRVAARCSGARPRMLLSMAKDPIVFAMANPDPEITFEEAKAARSDVIMATGRSDYPNQVNNVLGFPFIFRGALDVRATTINEAMKLAATKALAALAKEEVPESVCNAYHGESFRFGVRVVNASMWAQARPGSVLIPTWNIIGLVAEPSVQLHIPTIGILRSSRKPKGWA